MFECVKEVDIYTVFKFCSSIQLHLILRVWYIITTRSENSSRPQWESIYKEGNVRQAERHVESEWWKWKEKQVCLRQEA
jgi:hypothetical protein